MVFIQHSDVPIHPGCCPCTHDDGRQSSPGHYFIKTGQNGSSMQKWVSEPKPLNGCVYYSSQWCAEANSPWRYIRVRSVPSRGQSGRRLLSPRSLGRFVRRRCGEVGGVSLESDVTFWLDFEAHVVLQRGECLHLWSVSACFSTDRSAVVFFLMRTYWRLACGKLAVKIRAL